MVSFQGSMPLCPHFTRSLPVSSLHQIEDLQTQAGTPPGKEVREKSSVCLEKAKLPKLSAVRLSFEDGHLGVHYALGNAGMRSTLIGLYVQSVGHRQDDRTVQSWFCAPQPLDLPLL